MNNRYRTLFTLEIGHEYYDGRCADFDFLVPSETAATLRNGSLLARVRDGVLHLLVEVDRQGDARRPISGARLRLGLRLLNPLFPNFTALAVEERLLVFRNGASAAALDAPVGAWPAGALIAHRITKGTRTVDLVLEDDAGDAIDSQSVVSLEDDDFSWDAARMGLANGLYRVAETYPNTSGEARYYLHAELARRHLFGVVEIELAPALYAAASPTVFRIQFQARAERLKYYVIARKYSDAEMGQLSVSDLGAAVDARPAINFQRVERQNFSDQDIAPELLAGPGEKIVLFRSSADVPRRARARRKIQLKRNSDVLIPHLPAPAQEKARADLIVHLRKP
jgi:hypothetical protein